jgi:polyhydroxyalkanoate synthesis regulator protein
MLPVNFLRQLIGMYGGNMQPMVPQYLEASLEQLQRNQAQLRDAMSGALAANPFAEMARRNMELFTAAATGRGQQTAAQEAAADAKAEPSKADLDALRAELAALKGKLDKLGG